MARRERRSRRKGKNKRRREGRRRRSRKSALGELTKMGARAWEPDGLTLRNYQLNTILKMVLRSVDGGGFLVQDPGMGKTSKFSAN